LHLKQFGLVALIRLKELVLQTERKQITKFEIQVFGFSLILMSSSCHQGTNKPDNGIIVVLAH
jgi:hypothetical protein